MSEETNIENTEVEFKDPRIIATMSPGLYWEWRCTIEEQKVAKLDYRRVHLEKQLMIKDLEIQKLRMATFKSVETRVQVAMEESDKEYKRMKARIEEELGIDFSECAVDEYTYEVKSLKQDQED